MLKNSKRSDVKCIYVLGRAATTFFSVKIYFVKMVHTQHVKAIQRIVKRYHNRIHFNNNSLELS